MPRRVESSGRSRQASSGAEGPEGGERSAGVVPVRWVHDEWRVLLLRAYRYWDFPKGRVEAGETPFEAARREAREEAGLEDLDFRWGLESYRTEPYGRNKVAEYYLAETRTEEIVLGVNPELGRPEHHEGRWLTAAEARPLVNQRILGVLRWALARLQDSGSRP